MSEPWVLLSAPRHRCLSCGTCCQGVYIELSDDEQARVTEQAEALGVTDPVDDGGLRFEDGHCVFLGEDLLCNIHRRWGGEAKPRVCQQFPFVAIRTESERRAGIDPACGTAWRTWQDGPELMPDEMIVRSRPLDPQQHVAERAIVGAAGQPGQTVAGLLHLLCTGRPGGPELPPGLASRWITRLHDLDLPELLARSDTGAAIRRALTPLAGAIGDLDPDQPPDWPILDDDLDAWAVEATRRVVFLRLAARIPSVQLVALLTLLGAVACAWGDRAPDAWGPAFAGWCRVIRFRRVWQVLARDAETVAWLATGR